MEPAEAQPRPYTLQRAAIVVFAFVSILPLLLYLDTLLSLRTPYALKVSFTHMGQCAAVVVRKWN